MRKRLLFGFATWLAIGSSACTTMQPARPHLETAKACTEWRWIGISRPEVRCPEVPGWTVRPLFPQLASSWSCGEKESGPTPELIRELNRFCVYETTKSGKGPRDLPFPPSASDDLVRFDQDCAAIATTDRELDAQDRRGDQDLLRPQQSQPIDIGNPAGVRLAFLDTQPDGVGVPSRPGNSRHGFTLAHLARQLLCAPGSNTHCAAQITTRLALPIVAFDPVTRKNNVIDPVGGGHIGMQSDLAEAIRDEVDDWRAANAQRRLVLNLSVAWDGNLFDGLGREEIAQMQAGTQAVYYALEYAAAFDVLVLAAAGNQRVEPCDNYGPLLPAAWEKAPPRNGTCPRKYPDTPLVYAVGGVYPGGQRLANARPGGMPRRAAYGETPVLLSVNPDQIDETRIYSGSSVATAYASAVAAAVWSADPGLSPAEVMERLDSKGPELPWMADFWSGDEPRPAVRMVSDCAVMNNACGGSPCPVRLQCSPLGQDVAPPPLGVEVSSLGSCQPWLHPQPDDPPCLNPNCPPKQISN